LLVAQKKPMICYDAAMLVEMGLYRKFRPLIAVTCNKELQLHRIMERNKFSPEEAQQRIDAQDADTKIRCADYLVENNGTLAELKAKVLVVLDQIKTTTCSQ
jgi:dephospho-CoA kinase